MGSEIWKAVSEAFSGVFIVRLIVGILITALTAWGVSFWTADYVVRANTSSAQDAMRSLQSSIENFNTSFQTTTTALQASIDANTRATDGLQQQMLELLRRSEAQYAAIQGVQQDVGRVAVAVQNAGIDIKISQEADPLGKTVGWSDLYKALDVEGGDDLYIRIPYQSPLE